MDDDFRMYSAMHDFIVSALSCDFTDEAQLSRFKEQYRQLVDGTAAVLGMASECGLILGEDESFLLVENLFNEAGYTPEQRAIAHFWRSAVLRHARDVAALNAAARRGDDPKACDPGGGMRSPHDIDDDEQF